MSRKRHGQVGVDQESTRKDCVFQVTKSYEEAVEDIGQRDLRARATITADVISFEKSYRASSPGGPLPERFHFKPLGVRTGLYRVNQIYVGAGMYRVVLLFIQAGTRAYLIDAFKKTKKENRNEVRTAIDRAAATWEALVRAGRESEH